MVKKIILVVISIINIFARFLSYMWNPRFKYMVYTFKRVFVTGLYARHFNYLGHNSLLGLNMKLKDLHYVYFGNNTTIGDRTVLTCFKVDDDPTLIIKDNISIGDDAHITCCNKIIIDNNVLIGKKVTISDNSHGARNELNINPKDRKIYSKGPIYINENVWIGDKVTILAGVSIGKGAIIGSNTVVTKDVPDFSVIVGSKSRLV